MKPADRIAHTLWLYYLCPHLKKWKEPVGGVVLNAPESDREEFRQLKSDDIANMRPEEAWAGMSQEDWDRERQKNEIHKLLLAHDREVMRHRKFTIPDNSL
jgi:hypothetical protein